MSVLAVLAVLAAPVVAGCGDDDQDQVRAVLERFGDATRDKDYQELCDVLFAPELVVNVRSVGLPCELAMKTSLGKLRRPTLEVDSVEVEGDQALGRVRTGAAGQRPSQDTIKLVKRDGRWLIVSLAAQQPQPPPPEGLP